jgi:aspartyl-tRNA(Asn)/glutamyl-tRNA(Gln) amidotransferase subunit A
MDILEKSALQLRDGIAGGKFTSVEATNAVFEAIEKYDNKVHCYISTFKEKALADAAAIDAKIAAGEDVGELGGVPVAIKDNMCTNWGQTTCASKILKNFKSPYNATVVDKLSAAGAVIIGKLNMDEFAMGSSTENSGFFPTCNPWDLSCVPGGSSGGSAASVAARLAFASLGSDTGGSIRQPASFCGVVGLKPTYGRVSRYGLVAFGSSLDQIGPLTRNVADAALMLNVISGYDKKDSTSVGEDMAPVKNYLDRIEKPVEDLKIAIVPEFNEQAGADVGGAVNEAIEVYKSLGAQIVEVKMPRFEYAVAVYYIIATAEASSNLARFDGVHYGHRSSEAENYIDVYTKSREEGFGQEVKRRIMLGTYALSSGYYDAYYLKALKVRNLIREDFKAAFQKADCLLLPTSPTTAFKFGEKTADPLEMYLADIYTIALNLAGMPGISIPCGFDGNNMPIGMQLITDNFTEDKLLAIANMFESKTEFSKKKPFILREGG